MSGVDEGNGIVASAFQRAFSTIDSGTTVLAPVFGPTVKIYKCAANRGTCQGGSVMGISADCLFREIKCAGNCCFRMGGDGLERA
jgi:hypothetical protein